MFYDRAKIYVKGGNGGDGCLSFRREKYVPYGGPNGGDGGRGGNVYLEVDHSLSTLMDFKYRRHYKAIRGVHGKGSNMHGKDAKDLTLKVPPGTVVRDAETGEILADLVEDGQRFLAAAGGRGGRGNARFQTNKEKAPRIVENGEPGQERWIELELKLLADVGLAGYPNAGKSTLISSISAAKPKIADYPFTTLTPNLGVVDLESRSFVVADIPGLIEGAHLGAGLGHDFLKHLERTKLIVHVVDVGTEIEPYVRDPFGEYEQIREELKQYSPGFEKKPHLVAATKMDLPGAKKHLEELRKHIPKEVEIFPVSAVTHAGLDQLVERVADMLEEIHEPGICEDTEYRVVRPRAPEPFEIIQLDEHTYEIQGEEVIRQFMMNRMDTDEALLRFHKILTNMGVTDALRKKGVQPGDTVKIMEMEFEYVE